MRVFEFITILLLSFLIIEKLLEKNNKLKKPINIGLFTILILHILIEGARWQMSSIYLLSIIQLTLFFTKVIIHKKWMRVLGGILSFILIAFGVLLSYLIPVFDLPKIMGSHIVATKIVRFTVNNKDVDTLNIKAWYPTNKIGLKKDVYSKSPYNSLNGIMGMPGILFSHLKLVKTGAYEAEPDLYTEHKFPLVIYAHGASSTNVDNTALLQEIASHGYIVVAIDFDFSFERYGLSIVQASTLTLSAQKKFIVQLMDKVVPIQTEYISSVVEELKNKKLNFAKSIDFNQIVLLGHSLGGTTCSSVNKDDVKPIMIINIDGPMPLITDINVPFLYISSYSPDLSDKQLSSKGLPNVKFYRDVKKFELKNVSRFFENSSQKTHWVRFLNAGHIDFTDIPYMIPLMATNGYDKEKGHQIKSEVILNFINYYKHESQAFKQPKNKALKWLK